jgi:hypothetical protein
LSPLALLSVPLGMAILGIVVRDIYSTILHHWGGQGPLSGRLAKRMWRVIVRLTTRFGAQRRRQVLGQAGPLMIPLIVMLWAGLTILAFALLYWPWIATHFAPDSGAPEPTSFWDAFHFSGVSFFTIGYGDIVPVSQPMRLIGVIEGGAGFAMITLVISYFTALYAGYAQQKTIAQSVFFQAGMTADAARLIAQHVAGGSTVSMVNEVARLRDGLATLRSTVNSYPMLHYLVAARTEQSLARLLFVAQDLRLLLDTAIDVDVCPELAGLGERSGLMHSLAAVQADIADTLLIDGSVREDASPGPVLREAWSQRFLQARRTLAEAGLPVNRHPDAVEAYGGQRAEWEPSLRACTHMLGETWEYVTGGY